MRGTILKITVTGTCLALGMIGAVQAASAATSQESATGVTGTTVAQGSFEAAGRPMAGAPAVLYAWPVNSVLAGLKPGQRVPATVVGTATTDSSGRYAISAAQAGLESAAAPNGTVNLEVVALAPGEFASYSFSRTLGQMASGTISVPTASAVASADVSSAAVTSLARTTAGAAASAAAGAPEAGPQVAPSCDWLDIKSLGPAWTVVGATFDTTDDVTQHFTYSRGEESLLGVATSGSDLNSFTQSGSSTVTATGGEDFPSSTGAIDTRYQTKFVNSEFGYWCEFPGKYVSYQTRPTSWAAGALEASTGYPVANHYCVYQIKNSTFYSNNSSAYTFGAGFYIPVINLNLTAQTGYNSGASISYHFGIAHYLCGTADYPGGTPREIVAGKV